MDVPSRPLDAPKRVDPPLGDRQVIEALLARHLPGLVSWLRLHTGALIRSRESCSDIAQSVCREILEDLGSFEYRGEAAFRHWLFRTAERKVIDRHRYYTRAKRDAGREAGSGTAHHEEAADGSRETPSEAAGLREEIGHLEEAFDRLPEDYRQVILLFHVVGLPHQEIARQLGRTEPAVRNLLSRALARLARHLQSRRV